MPAPVSAGLLMYRRHAGALDVLLCHPGGPFFARKDEGAWTIPKGLPEPGEELLAAARREFAEEIGWTPPATTFVPLGEIRQKAGKIVHAWAFEGELPAGFVPTSTTFELEWPPRSGRRQRFPEVDRAELFSLPDARVKINPAQAAFLDRLAERVG